MAVTFVDETVGSGLRDAVWEQLDALTELANRADAPTWLAMARSELLRLTERWRTLLTVHDSDEKGDCRECSTRHRRLRAPCVVWRTAYEHLSSGALAPRPGRHPHRARGSRPVPVP